MPPAATVNEAEPPAVTVTLMGCVVKAGALVTVSTAAVEVSDPLLLVATSA